MDKSAKIATMNITVIYSWGGIISLLLVYAVMYVWSFVSLGMMILEFGEVPISMISKIATIPVLLFALYVQVVNRRFCEKMRSVEIISP